MGVRLWAVDRPKAKEWQAIDSNRDGGDKSSNAEGRRVGYSALIAGGRK